jgi:circadian clock protein KaiB
MERAKKARRRGSRKYATPREETYVFRLFVAGDESHSLQARRNLARLCEEHIKGRYTIDIVDVLKDPSTAYENNVLVTPTLLLIRPLPGVTVLGNLRDTSRVLAALRRATNKGSRPLSSARVS